MLPGKHIDDLSSEAVATLIDQCGWARHFQPDALRQLAPFFTVHSIGLGERLIKEGEKSPFLAILLEGKMVVVKTSGAGEEQTVCTVKAGQSVGEISLIDQFPPSASVVAVQESKVAILTESQFERLCKRQAPAAVVLLKKVSASLCANLRRTSGKLVEYLGSEFD